MTLHECDLGRIHPAIAGGEYNLETSGLRHTAATLLLASGVNAKVVSEMLGHSNVAITLRIYAHVLPHMQQSAVTAMDNLLASSQPREIDGILEQ